MQKKEVFEDTSGEGSGFFYHIKNEYDELIEYFKNRKFFFTIFFIFLIIVFVFFITRSGTNVQNEKVYFCGDGSMYESCSLDKPYYCSGNGILYSKASVCGCPKEMKKDDDNCVSVYGTNPKTTELKYFLNGNEGKLNFTSYMGLVDYLYSLPDKISYNGIEVPSRRDFKIRDISEENQRELLIPLVKEIQNSATTDTDQLRIAVSLVQNIEWGESSKKGEFGVGYSRYPYEVLYDSQGVCGEKSELLSFLLKEMGYDVAIFYNQKENHESVGVKCPVEKSWHGTGYCFIETSGPSIISDSSIEYSGGVRLDSAPETMILSEGKSLPADMYEYKDAEKMAGIRFYLNKKTFGFFEKGTYDKLRAKYNIPDFYRVG